MQRELWEVLVELVEAIDPKAASEFGMRIEDVTFRIPLEITLLSTDVGFRFIANVPQSRWREGIAAPLSQLHVTLYQQEQANDEQL